MNRPSHRHWSRRLAAWLASGHVLLLGFGHLPMVAEAELPPGVCSVRGMVSEARGANAAGGDASRSGQSPGRSAGHGLSCPLCTGADASAPPPLARASFDDGLRRRQAAHVQSHAQRPQGRPVRLVARGPPAPAGARPLGSGDMQAAALPLTSMSPTLRSLF